MLFDTFKGSIPDLKADKVIGGTPNHIVTLDINGNLLDSGYLITSLLPSNMTWRGSWNDHTDYVVNDVVEHNGSCYVATADNINHAPPDISYWDLVVSRGMGDVNGPASAVNGNLMAADGIAGKLIKDSGLSTANTSDAILKKHTQGTDQGLDTGGPNQTTVAQIKDAVDKRHSNALDHSNSLDHTQGTDQYLDHGGANEVSVANVKNAVTLKHSNALDHSNAKDHDAGKDQGLDTGGPNAVTVTQVKNAVNLAHSNSLDHSNAKDHDAGRDQGLDTGGPNAVTVAQVKTAVTQSHAQAADDNFTTLTELIAAADSIKIPCNDGAYKFITRGNLLSGITGGGTGFGNINYIANYGAEVNTAGWAAYADAASVSPADGIGGSPSITWTRTTTSPLRGTGSFLLAKDAANRQGQGASYNFSIDSADQAKMLSISLDYSSDVVLAEGDLTVWIYDVTNNVLIQPIPYRLPGSGAAVYNSWKGEFQTAYNSVSYRLIIHISSTSTTAWNIKFDNINVGPQPITQGVPITDWLYYPATVVGFGSNLSFVWTMSRRVGDTLEGWALIQTTTPTAVAASITLGFGGVNGIVVTEETKVGSSGVIGHGGISGGQSSTYFGGFNVLAVAGSNLIQFAVENSSASSINPSNGNAICSAGNWISFYYRVPIKGWSSNCQVSNDADTRLVAASLTISDSYISGINPNVNEVKIPFNQALTDTHGGWDAVNKRYVVKVPGRYVIDVCLNFWGTNILNTFYTVDVYKNGAAARRLSSQTPPALAGLTMQGCCEIDCVPGDYLEVYFYGGGNNSVNTLYLAGTQVYTRMEIVRISGPSQIAAVEKIYAEYNTASGQTIGKNWAVNIVNFDNKVADSHGAVTTGANWRFTAPRPDFYNVSSGVMDATAPTNDQLIIDLFKNGVDYTELARPFIGVANLFFSGSRGLYLNAGDYIDVRVGHSQGDNHVLNSNSLYNWIVVTSSPA